MRLMPFALAAVLAFSIVASATPAAAEDDPVGEAVRGLLDGVEGEARARAERIVRSDPEAAVRALLGATRTRSAGGFLVVRKFPSMPRELGVLPAPADEADDEHVVQVHDVRDLTQGKLKAEALAARLRSVVGEASAITATKSGAIVVVAPPAAHAATRQILDRLRTADATLFAIDARLIMVPMTAAVGSEIMRARSGEVVALDDPVSRVREWVRSGDVQVVASPTVSCLRGQTGAVQIGRQISYVSDFDVEISQSTFIADPIIDVVWDGVLAEFSAWPGEEGAIQLSMEVSVSDVEEPLQTFQTSVGSFGDPVTIQIPSYVRTEINRSLTVADGGTALVRLADGPDARRLILLTVRKLELADMEGAAERDD